MIVLSICNTCFQPFKIVLVAEEAGLVKQVSDVDAGTCPCPRLCGGNISLTDVSDVFSPQMLRNPMTITGKELYQAVNGLGLRDEIPNDPLVVDALFKASEIKSVLLEEHNGCVFLHEIALSNGATVHLSSGGRGAQVLKITKRGNVDAG